MKVLVVGGAGYIGSHAVYELVRAGHDVAVLDNLSTGLRRAVHGDARFYQGDIRVKQDVLAALDAEKKLDGKPVDVVMHFAAKLIVPESMEQPLAYYDNNVGGLRTMLEAMVGRGIRNVVFSSTAATYGEPVNPICHEDDLKVPVNPYGETKLACEKMIQWVAAAHGMNYCIFRYFNVAGADSSLEIGLEKDQLTHLIPIIMQAALGMREKIVIFGDDYDTPDGTCIRDYIHVTDLAQAHVLGAEYLLSQDASLICNLGSGTGYSVRQVVDEALKHFDFVYEYGERRPGDPAKLIASNQRAKELLGWEPKLGLADMITSDYAFRKKCRDRDAG